MELEYLREYYLDPDDPAIFWMKIKTPSGTEGYISSLLLAYEAD
jgi:hypothetical protein